MTNFITDSGEFQEESKYLLNFITMIYSITKSKILISSILFDYVRKKLNFFINKKKVRLIRTKYEWF